MQNKAPGKLRWLPGRTGDLGLLNLLLPNSSSSFDLFRCKPEPVSLMLPVTGLQAQPLALLLCLKLFIDGSDGIISTML